MRTSSIYTVPAGEQPEWAEGVPHFGWVYATRAGLPLPAELTEGEDEDVIHCAQGTEPPSNVRQVIIKGHETPWEPLMIVAGWPNGHVYVMEATWQEGEEMRRGKMVEIPDNVTPIETLLIPHCWAGEEIATLQTL